MRRVLVIGSGGAGKSTFASRLGERTGLPVIHLDALFWRAGWNETPPDEWRHVVNALLERDTWVIDGNYGGTQDARIAVCDLVIFLDLPRRVCLWRVFRRWVRYRGRARPDMAEGCNERLTLEFVRWIWRYPSTERPRILAKLAMLESGQRAVVLRSTAEVEAFLVTAKAPSKDAEMKVAQRSDPVAEFLDAACVPTDASHASGTLERAESIRAAHPDVATASIHTAAILGDEAAVRRFLADDPSSAARKGGPRDWDPLTHLCFSRYLRLDRARSAGFLRAATALLDAGASASTGWWEPSHQPETEWEGVLYGASGVAHDADLTRLLLERGADPNDNETVYHTPETYDNAALEVLVGTGKLTTESLALLLVRKHDWHDEKGVAWLLEHGADPNAQRWRGLDPLHHALHRDNSLAIITLLLDHGADPTRESRGVTGVALAARMGRGDVLALLRERGIPFCLRGADTVIAACALNDGEAVRAIAEREPEIVREILAQGGARLAAFAGAGNADGVRHLLDLGVPVDAPFHEGDGYWGISRGSTALHVAAWRAQHDVVALLVARGAAVNARDGEGRTPLMLAVRASVDSYWTWRRTPESVRALLAAGASPDGVPYPSGYNAVDALIAAARDVQGKVP